MFSTGFELAIPGFNRPQNYALDRAATGIGWKCIHLLRTVVL